MKKENDTNTKRERVANDGLLAALRKGELPISPENAEYVKNAYCKAVQWNAVFDGAGLSDLEDPEQEMDERLYEEWLEKAFRDNFSTDEECKKAIQSVRAAVLNSLG